MATIKNGKIGVTTENIFPVIKKFLYSDHEIFLRELVSNAVDATQKIITLASSGAFNGELGNTAIHIAVDSDAKTLTITDRGIGMTAEEVDKYINQIAFSGAGEFLEKYQNQAIIGHFGLGFYSAFMVSDKVEIFSQSYKEGSKAVHWSCTGSPEFEMEELADSRDRGTTIVLHLSEDCAEYASESKVGDLLKKYCHFLPVEIIFGKVKEWKDGKYVDTDKDNVINNTTPLWTVKPTDITEQQYKDFYQELYPMSEDPLFYIHLNIDYPFNLTGILYFPKIRHELDSSKGRIKLFCNQVFVTDNAKEIIPEFLTLLQGCIDIPDLPLNVSRSYLQNDPYVKKISEHITKKVADKLNEIYKKDRAAYEGFWDDISIFVKYGMMNNEKFFDKVKNVLMFKTSDDVYKTLEEYKEKNKGINKEENGKQVVLYASDPEKQAALIDMCKGQGLEVIYFNSMIDVHFIQFLEMKDTGVSFIRIDSDTNAMLSDDKKEKIVDENNKSIDDKIEELFNSILKPEENKSLKIKVQALKDTKIPSIIVFSEHMRRFKEMNAMFRGEMGGADIFSDHTLIINSSNEMISKLVAAKDNADKKELVEKLVLNVMTLHFWLKTT